MQHHELYNSIIRMNIDVDPKTKRRPNGFYQIERRINMKITKVPTIITGNFEYALSDKDAFQWLDAQIKSITKSNVGIQGFNTTEMTSLSDSYSKFGSTDLFDATEQSFKFYKSNDKGGFIIPDDNYTESELGFGPENTGGLVNGFLYKKDNDFGGSPSRNIQSERDMFEREQQKNTRMQDPKFAQQYQQGSSGLDNNFQQRQQSYQNHNSQQNQPQIDFTNPNIMGYARSQGQGQSQKQADVLNRLQQLEADRKAQGLDTQRFR